MFNVMFAAVCVVILVIVFTARPRKERALKRGRRDVLQRLAPVVAGALSDGLELVGSYERHPVDVTLRTAGRIDSIGDHHSAQNNLELILIVLRHVEGGQPWGFYTSISAGPGDHKWRSTTTLGGMPDRLLRRLTPFPVDPALDDRLRQGGLFDALDRLASNSRENPYILVSYVPDGAEAAQTMVRRLDEGGGRVPDKARRELQAHLDREQGGHLRVEVERGSAQEPSPERFREILDAAVAIATLNAALNPPSRA